jgi:hypothetical protein
MPAWATASGAKETKLEPVLDGAMPRTSNLRAVGA